MTIRHDDLAEIVLHHAVSSVVDNGQCLFPNFGIFANLFLDRKHGFFDSGQAEVLKRFNIQTVESVF